MALSRKAKTRIYEIVLLIVAALAGATLIISLINPQRSIAVLFIAGLVFTGSLLLLLSSWLNPDRIRAAQSDAMLSLAGKTFETVSNGGLSAGSAQEVCEFLLPASSAVAVSITDTSTILGYAGRGREFNEPGSPIRTPATLASIDDGQMRVLRTRDSIGFPEKSKIHAGIIAPLSIGEETVGTLKFYYPSSRWLNETQESIVRGFADLLSTQLSARALEEQRKLATSMELKVLQSQINPHFLFNTINTISSFIRTDPAQARDLLREFATFYRRTLEDASDLIPLERELDQTARYLGFEIARFGKERLCFTCDVDEGLGSCMVPAFMVQPLVENAVRHAMPSEGTLHISCKAWAVDDSLYVTIEDDGVGMSEDEAAGLLSESKSEGLGIAMRNIKERITGYYGPDSYMKVESKIGEGTRITLLLKGAYCMLDPHAVRQDDVGVAQTA